MKRFDVIIILVVLALATSIYLIVKGNTKDDTSFIATNHGEVILRVNAYDNKQYSIIGDNGVLILEVKDGSIRVVESDCPLHHCENQGWISIDERMPIICLPNGVLISSETAEYN